MKNKQINTEEFYDAIMAICREYEMKNQWRSSYPLTEEYTFSVVDKNEWGEVGYADDDSGCNYCKYEEYLSGYPDVHEACIGCEIRIGENGFYKKPNTCDMNEEIKKKYPIQDDVWPSRRWNEEGTDYCDLSGCKATEELVKVEYQSEKMLRGTEPNVKWERINGEVFVNFYLPPLRIIWRD